MLYVLAILAFVLPAYSYAQAVEPLDIPTSYSTKIGRVKLSCDRHKVKKSEWTKEISNAEEPCKELIDDIKAAHEEYSKLVKQAGAKEAEVSSKAVQGGKDIKSMQESAIKVMESAMQEYEKLAQAARLSANELKEKYSKNENAIKVMKNGEMKLTEAERVKRVEIMRLQNFVSKYSNSTDSDVTKKVEENKTKVAALSKEKEPIDAVVKGMFFKRAIEEQGKVVTSGRAMEKLMRDAEKDGLAKKADMKWRKSRLAHVDFSSGDDSASKEISDIIGEKAAKADPSKPSLWNRMTSGWGDPVPENIAGREKLVETELRNASEQKLEHEKVDGLANDPDVGDKIVAAQEKAAEASAKKGSSGATKLSEDVFDNVFESDLLESKMAKEGAIHGTQKVGEIDVSGDSTTERKVADVNSKLTEATIAQLKEDRERLGGDEGFHKKAKEVAENLDQRRQRIEELARGMPQDIHTGEMKKVESSAPYFERQQQLEAELKARNEYLADECKQNKLICTRMNDLGEKFVVGRDDIDRVRTGNMARAQLGEQYALKDGSQQALSTLSKEGAQEETSKYFHQRIADMEFNAKRQEARAEGLQDLRDHIERTNANADARGINRIGGEEQAIQVTRQKFTTDNSAAAGIVNHLTSSQSTKDDLGDDFDGLMERRKALGTAELLPFGGVYKSIDSYSNYSQLVSQRNLLPESFEAMSIAKESYKDFEKDGLFATGGLVATGVMGGAAKTTIGGAIRDVGQAATKSKSFDFAEGYGSMWAKEGYKKDFWVDAVALETKAKKISEAYSEEAALAKFSSEQKTAILARREGISAAETRLENTLAKFDELPLDEPVPRALSKQVLAESKQHAQEVEAFMNATGREGGEIVKIDAVERANGQIIPAHYVYEMQSRADVSKAPSGFAQHDNFLRQMPDYRIQFDPVQNVLSDAKGFEETNTKLLSLRSANPDFSRRGTDTTFLHEGMHGRFFNDINEGTPTAFHANYQSAVPDLVPVGPKGYQEFNSAQEMATFRMAAKEERLVIEEAAVLRRANKEIPPKLQEKLAETGLTMDDITPHGVPLKRPRALNTYSQQTIDSKQHFADMKNKIDKDGMEAYYVRQGDHGEDIAVFETRDLDQDGGPYGNFFTRTEIVVPGKETYFEASADGFRLNKEVRHQKIMSIIDEGEKTSKKLFDESQEMITQARGRPDYVKTAQESANDAKPYHVLAKEYVEANPKFTEKAQKLVANTVERAGRKLNESTPYTSAIAASRGRNLSAASRSVEPFTGIVRTRVPAKTVAASVSTPVSRMLGFFGKQVPIVVGKVVTDMREAIANVLPERVQNFVGLNSPESGSLVNPLAASKLVPVDPARAIAEAGTPSNVSNPAAVATPNPTSGSPVTSSRPNSSVSNSPDSNMSSPSVAKGDLSNLASPSGAGGGAPTMPSMGSGGGGESDLSAARFPGSVKDGHVEEHSDISGATDEKKLAATPSPLGGPGAGENNGIGSSGGGSSNGASTRSGTGASKLGTLAKGAQATGTPGEAAAAAALDAKKAGVKSMSLKEKLTRLLANGSGNEMGSIGGGMSTSFAGGANGPVNAGDSAALKINANPGADAQSATAYLADPDSSLFMRIRRAHIKYLERKI